jgi:copper(I)-binding protein
VNRAKRAAVMGALVLSPVALSACSGGQVTQTGTQDRDKVGPQAQVEDILLRQVLLAYPEGGRYEQGDDAELIVTILNESNTDDTLTGIEGEGFGSVLVAPTGPTPSPSSPAGNQPTATPTPGGTGATPGSSPSAPAAPSASPSAGTRLALDLPADTALYIGREDGATITLQDLGEELTPGQNLTLTFSFEQAGEITTQVLVAGPEEEIERPEPFDFEEGLEPENPESEEDTVAE